MNDKKKIMDEMLKLITRSEVLKLFLHNMHDETTLKETRYRILQCMKDLEDKQREFDMCNKKDDEYLKKVLEDRLRELEYDKEVNMSRTAYYGSKLNDVLKEINQVEQNLHKMKQEDDECDDSEEECDE